MKPLSRRDIPAVNRVLEALDAVDLPRPVIVAIVRRELSALRASDNIVEFREVLAHVLDLEHFGVRRMIGCGGFGRELLQVEGD